MSIKAKGLALEKSRTDDMATEQLLEISMKYGHWGKAVIRGCNHDPEKNKVRVELDCVSHELC